MIGATLSHYHIVEQIGAGGMGVVYRAQDTDLKRDVAVKVLPQEVAGDPGRLERFKREAQTIAKLNHPNILAIHELGTHEGAPFIVTELLEGENLRRRIPASGLSWQRATEIGAAIADGLSAAHGKGIVHRDLKPENIFLTSDGRVKILDFGLAQVKEPVREEAETATLTPAGTVPGTVMGTVGYMSPEQVRGKHADARSDIFALGCVLYEMLTGKIAFARDSTADTQAAILKEEPPPPTSTGVTLPAEFERTITRCLEKSADARFQSASDLAFALRSITTDQAVVMVRPGRRRKTLWSVAAALLIVIGAFAAALALGLFHRSASESQKEPIRSIALLPLENLTGDPEQAYFVDGLHSELISTFSQISAFDKVIARTSVMAFRTSDTPIRGIGELLGVDAILEGSVQQVGDSVRATLRLFDARTEEHLWTDSFDRDLTDVLALQSDVARAVAGKVEIALTPDEDRRLNLVRPVGGEAYRAYLMAARLLPWHTSERNMVSTLRLFESAIELDPELAESYVGLSKSLLMLAHFFRDPREIMPRAYAAALEAVELNPDLPDAHAALGHIKLWWQWDLDGAKREIDRALELDPSNFWALGRLAEYWAIVGEPDNAFASNRRSIELNPMSESAQGSFGWVCFLIGRPKEGIAQLEKAQRLFPDSVGIDMSLAWNYSIDKRPIEALAALERAKQKHPAPDEDPLFLFSLAYVYGNCGKTTVATSVVDRLEHLRKTRYVPPSSLAASYWASGDHDRAFELAEEALEIHDTQLWAFVTPYLHPWRNDPRCRDIRRRMIFPED